jgi:hypothetical protein
MKSNFDGDTQSGWFVPTWHIFKAFIDQKPPRRLSSGTPPSKGGENLKNMEGKFSKYGMY